MGEVYLAQDTELEREVALKILAGDVAVDLQRMQRFVQEAKTASALNHPNIITIYEVGQAEGLRFIATEYIKGETLRQRMRREPLSLSECFEVAVQVAAALAAAHEANVVHRDIKPENIMLRPDGLVKVLDFGLAKLTEPAVEESAPDSNAPTRVQINTAPGVVMGTFNYMSPEQARGKEVDARTDIWAVGVVLYELLTGRLPFTGETTSDVMAAILKNEPASLTVYAPDTPPELQRIVRKTLRKDRNERYHTVRDLLTDLKSLQRELDFAAERERSMPLEVDGATDTGTGATGTGERSTTLATPTPTDSAGPRATSSAEYLITQIKNHKTIALALVLLAVLGISAAFWGRSRLKGAFERADAQSSVIKSIAVLPFANVGGDADTEYLSDGLTESLINNLSQLRDLTVKSRSSVFRYKGINVESQVVANELGVQAVLLGQMTQRGSDLSLSVELVEARTGNHLWGEHYDRKVGDLVAVQSEITRDVLEKLRRRLSSSEQQRANKSYTADAEAYQLYLKGRFYWNKRTEESYQKAIDYFRQAIEKDPNYALAYTGLADSYSFLSGQGIRPPHDVFPQAKQAAAKAIEIDNSLSEAHTSLAYVKLYYDWDWTGAEREYLQAIELNPNYATPHHGYAYLLISSGRTEAAIAEIKKAEEIDPLSLVIQTDHGEYYYFARRPDEAIAQLQKALDMDSSFVRAHFLLGRALIQKGQCDQGIDEAVKAEKMVPAIEALGWLAQEYAICGRQAEAQKAMSELLDMSKNHYVSPHWFAAVQAGLGNKDEAFKWLDQAFDRRFGPLIYLKVNPIWDPLRSDPRFAERLRRVGLTP